MGAALFGAASLALLVAYGVVQGLTYIATAGFLRLAFASLFLSTVLSLLLSSLASVTLVTYVEPLEPLQGSPAGVAMTLNLLKVLLAAFAQPTLTGVVMLAVLLLVCFGVAQVVGLAEEIQILLDVHKSLASTELKKER